MCPSPTPTPAPTPSPSPTPDPSPTPAPSPDPSPSPSPDPMPHSLVNPSYSCEPVSATPPKKKKIAKVSPTPAPSPVYNQAAIAGYAQQAQAQIQLINAIAPKYDQRVFSETKNGNTWTRAGTDNFSPQENTAFGYTQNSHFIQVGKDVYEKVNNNKTISIGVTGALAEQKTKFYDKSRAPTAYGSATGNASNTTFTAGAYYTLVQVNEQYLDVQTHLVNSKTQLEAVDAAKATQNGNGFLVSGEAGKSFPIMQTGYMATPQAQLVYQQMQYGSINDGKTLAAKQTADSLRARAGVNLSKAVAKDAATKNDVLWNTSVNYWTELKDSNLRSINGQELATGHQQNDWLELSFGLSKIFINSSILNAQITYKEALKGNSDGGLGFQVSYRINW